MYRQGDVLIVKASISLYRFSDSKNLVFENYRDYQPIQET